MKDFSLWAILKEKLYNPVVRDCGIELGTKPICFVTLI